MSVSKLMGPAENKVACEVSVAARHMMRDKLKVSSWHRHLSVSNLLPAETCLGDFCCGTRAQGCLLAGLVIPPSGASAEYSLERNSSAESRPGIRAIADLSHCPPT